MIEASEPIPFGEWMPDQAAFSNAGALVVKNCLTEKEKYKPFADLVENTNELPGAIGGIAYRDAVGNVIVFAATRTGIYRLDGLDWVEVTRVDGMGDPDPYTTAEDGFWDFKTFGTLVIATNYNDDIQCFDVGTSTEFEQLSATAPRARTLMVLSNFLVAMDTADSDGAVGYKVRWSPIADPRGDWTPDPTVTQADSQNLYGGDYAIAAGINIGDYGLLIQGKVVWRMQYVGGATIFAIERVENARGSTISRSCISDGDRGFYIGEDGFYMFAGGQSIPIGAGKVDKTFYKMLDQAYTYNISSAIDPINKVVMWSFPSINSNGMPDAMILYNWADDRFTLIEQSCLFLFVFMSIGYTLDGLDALYPILENIPFSLDSRYWVGGKTILGAFSANGKLGAFSGTPKTATIGTSEIRGNNSGKTTIHSIIPLIEGGSKRGRIGKRDFLTTPPVWSVQVTPNRFTDEFDFMSDAMYHRCEIEISGSWEMAHGISLRALASGNV